MAGQGHGDNNKGETKPKEIQSHLKGSIGIRKMSTITKQELVNRIAQSADIKIATVKTVMQHLLDQITHELVENNRLELRDFGVFEPRTQKARIAQNPTTKEDIQVPAKRVVRFKMGRKMRTMMDEVTSQSTLYDHGVC